MSSAGIFILIESDGVDMRELEALGITLEEYHRTQKSERVVRESWAWIESMRVEKG